MIQFPSLSLLFDLDLSEEIKGNKGSGKIVQSWSVYVCVMRRVNTLFPLVLYIYIILQQWTR
jgi:hypothetical protein